MVSLKSFLHYFSPARPAQPLSEAEKQQIEALIQAFGGEANITQVDACITRLRVSGRGLRSITAAGRARGYYSWSAGACYFR